VSRDDIARSAGLAANSDLISGARPANADAVAGVTQLGIADVIGANVVVEYGNLCVGVADIRSSQDCYPIAVVTRDDVLVGQVRTANREGTVGVGKNPQAVLTVALIDCPCAVGTKRTIQQRKVDTGKAVHEYPMAIETAYCEVSDNHGDLGGRGGTRHHQPVSVDAGQGAADCKI